ncbi:hypothetical protein [Sulfurospirillum halorespirans]|uniref:Uncharacterized protein n=1 Tax=Sulfurospirillum halorespirans DSM 13726 TaxID=1193502 RepID=A0A1D7TIT6_9BACT|nr:hypothetical protein [Sulfurospirillum halorespirans]AOO64942.1 hypothetical protein SHALO_1162 [Sulfurospirillum halorespirans DSM 13726]
MLPNAVNPKKTTKSLKPKTTAKKVASKARKTDAKKVPKRPSLLLNLLASCVVLLFIGFGIKYVIDHTINYNPLLGKWRAQTVLGIMEIEFDRSSISSFGTKNPVTYDILEDKVIVIDDTIKVGNTYKIVDENTISTEAGGFKTVYKKVK